MGCPPGILVRRVIGAIVLGAVLIGCAASRPTVSGPATVPAEVDSPKGVAIPAAGSPAHDGGHQTPSGPDESRTRGSEFTRVIMGVQARIRIVSPIERTDSPSDADPPALPPDHALAPDRTRARGSAREASPDPGPTTSPLAAAAAAFGRMADLESVISDYRVDSDVTRVAESAGGPPVVVSPAMVAATHTALGWARRTGGAFDPTVGPATQRWRAMRNGAAAPSADEQQSIRALVDFRRVDVNARDATVRLPVAGMRLDFGGIGKGMAADAALAELRERGARSALVSVAGDVAAGDPPPGAAGWRVIAGRDGEVEPARLIIANQAISTSGDTGQYVEIDGQRYAHIVDPRTGIGARARRAVSVLSPTATTADALASAIFVLGDGPLTRALVAGEPGTAVRIHDAEAAGPRTVIIDPHGAWADAVRRASDS